MSYGTQPYGVIPYGVDTALEPDPLPQPAAVARSKKRTDYTGPRGPRLAVSTRTNIQTGRRR